MKLAGIVPALGTPLLSDESVDEAGIRRLIDYAVRGFAFLNDDEQIRATGISVAAADGRVPVIVGLGETGARRAVATSRAIARQGVEAIALERERRISVLSGSEHLAPAGLPSGCDGCVGGSYNICQQIAVGLYTAFHEGAIAAARKFQQSLIAAWNIFLRGAPWGAFDEARPYLQSVAAVSK